MTRIRINRERVQVLGKRIAGFNRVDIAKLPRRRYLPHPPLQGVCGKVLQAIRVVIPPLGRKVVECLVSRPLRRLSVP